MSKKVLCEMEKNIIIKKTNSLLNNFGYNNEADTYVDISKLAVSEGFKVGETSRIGFKEDGFIAISKDKSNKIIGVNSNRTFEEKRFIVAHELAHYYLHYIDSTLEGMIMHREQVKGKDENENDADFFAACMLMPAQSFKTQFEKLKLRGYGETDVIDKLQLIYKTPRESIIRRIEEVC